MDTDFYFFNDKLKNLLVGYFFYYYLFNTFYYILYREGFIHMQYTYAVYTHAISLIRLFQHTILRRLQSLQT